MANDSGKDTNPEKSKENKMSKKAEEVINELFKDKNSKKNDEKVKGRRRPKLPSLATVVVDKSVDLSKPPEVKIPKRDKAKREL